MIKIVATKINPLTGETRRVAEQKAVRKCLECLGCKGELCHTPAGAPYIDGAEAKISISHSRRWAAVAMSPNKNEALGIDVESAEREGQLDRAISRIAGLTELPYLKDVTPKLKLWTVKEAAYKAVLCENVDFAKDITLIFPDCDKVIFSPAEKELKVSFLQLDNNDLLCVVSEHNNYEIKTL